MKQLCKALRDDDHGVLTFEWILLITLLVIGIVGGLSAVRDALIDELGDVAAAAVNIDQSYTVEACSCASDPGGEPLGNSFGYQDTVPTCPAGTAERQRSQATGQTVEQCP
ncbi:MAG: hypothetical protein JXB62_10295 [Pirellulales bacterium]|nr:hypothetical protein [Pirellulales bacterium]